MMNHNSRVCHLTSVHSAHDIRIFKKEACSLAALYDVHLVAINALNETVDGVTIHGICIGRHSRFYRATIGAWKIFRQAKVIDPEIYHLHDPEMLFWGLLLKMRGKKVIFDSHEDFPADILTKDWIPKPLRNLISTLGKKVENIIVSKLDALVAATPSIATNFHSINSNVICINNYPIVSEFYNNTPRLTKKHDERCFCYVGGISAPRGIVQMIDALSNTNAKLILAGTFSDQKLRQSMLQKSGWKRVNELGHISREELRTVFTESIAGLVLFLSGPNHDNSLPNKIFEYMSAGLPVIASNFPLWEDIINTNSCGLCVNPLNPDEIARAMVWIMNNPEEGNRMGKNGLEAINKRYNWESESIKLLALYKELMSCVA